MHRIVVVDSRLFHLLDITISKKNGRSLALDEPRPPSPSNRVLLLVLAGFGLAGTAVAVTASLGRGGLILYVGDVGGAFAQSSSQVDLVFLLLH
jgi:hypothetical protein